jgi:hypothetical protein
MEEYGILKLENTLIKITSLLSKYSPSNIDSSSNVT